MMHVDNYRFHRRAAVCSTSWTPTNKRRCAKDCCRSMGLLPASGPRPWPRGSRATDRAILCGSMTVCGPSSQAVEGQQPEVLDIASQEMLDFLAHAAAKNGACQGA